MTSFLRFKGDLIKPFLLIGRIDDWHTTLLRKCASAQLLIGHSLDWVHQKRPRLETIHLFNYYMNIIPIQDMQPYSNRTYETFDLHNC